MFEETLQNRTTDVIQYIRWQLNYMQHNHNSRFEMFNIRFLDQLLKTGEDHTGRVDGTEDAGGFGHHLC